MADFEYSSEMYVEQNSHRPSITQFFIKIHL